MEAWLQQHLIPGRFGIRARIVPRHILLPLRDGIAFQTTRLVVTHRVYQGYPAIVGPKGWMVGCYREILVLYTRIDQWTRGTCARPCADKGWGLVCYHHHFCCCCCCCDCVGSVRGSSSHRDELKLLPASVGGVEGKAVAWFRHHEVGVLASVGPVLGDEVDDVAPGGVGWHHLPLPGVSSHGQGSVLLVRVSRGQVLVGAPGAGGGGDDVWHSHLALGLGVELPHNPVDLSSQLGRLPQGSPAVSAVGVGSRGDEAVAAWLQLWLDLVGSHVLAHHGGGGWWLRRWGCWRQVWNLKYLLHGGHLGGLLRGGAGAHAGVAVALGQEAVDHTARSGSWNSVHSSVHQGSAAGQGHLTAHRVGVGVSAHRNTVTCFNCDCNKAGKPGFIGRLVQGIKELHW